MTTLGREIKKARAALGWRQEQVARNAEEIQLIGRDLYDRLRTMVAHLEAVGRVRLGAMTVKPGATGTLFFDEFVSVGAGTLPPLP